MTLLTSGTLQGVHPAHRFDEAGLLRYLQAAIPGFPQPPATLHVYQV